MQLLQEQPLSIRLVALRDRDHLQHGASICRDEKEGVSGSSRSLLAEARGHFTSEVSTLNTVGSVAHVGWNSESSIQEMGAQPARGPNMGSLH